MSSTHDDLDGGVTRYVLADDYDRLREEYNTLLRRYEDVRSQHAQCDARIERVNKKYNAAKKCVKEWKVYIDRKALLRTNVPRECPIDEPHIARPMLDLPSETDGVLLHADAARGSFRNLPKDDGGDISIEGDTRPDALPFKTPSGDSNIDVPRHSTRSDENPKRVTSSQSTEDDQQSDQDVDRTKREASSDDMPTVVSVRFLKRRRSGSKKDMPPPRRIKQEPNSLADPIELRSEDFSSPAAMRQPRCRMETSDLDALATQLETPRKHQRHSKDGGRAVSVEFARPTVKRTRRVSSFLDSERSALTWRSPRVKIEQEATTSSNGRRRGQACRREDLAPQTADWQRQANVLRPLSTNMRMSPNKSSKPKAGRGSKRDDGSDKVACLSEDGDQDDSLARPTKFKRSPDRTTPKAVMVHRLDTMLDKPSPERRPLPRRSTPEVTSTVGRKRQPQKVEPVSVAKSAPKDQDTPRFRLPCGFEESPPPVRPEDEPLRLRPIGMLHLEDFKINPKYMGADYAFAGTLRGRDQRRCMQGCTNPACCGSAFRKAVEIAGAQISGKSDTELLQAYLGDDFATIMGAYDKIKRKDLLMQARAYAFANQHGRHRQAFERRSTPPGFWRADMPTTQEEHEDRLKANEMVRQKIEERWREAMREGGRWLFRDE